MRIINLSFTYVNDFSDPELWLRRIGFSTGILESLSRFADVIGVYNIDYKGELSRNGVTYCFPHYQRWGLFLPFLFNRFIKKLSPDAVIIHGLISPWQVIMLRWQLGSKLKIIVQHHAELPLRDFRQYLQKWADRYIHTYLFSSLELGQPWVERGQICDIRKIKEIMGSSSPFFIIERDIARAKVNIVGETVFLWVGDLDTNKDPLIVASAFIRFLEVTPNAKLFMIYQTDQLHDELRRLIASAPASSESIILVGKIENAQLLYWYNSADFIISSSHYEGAGIAVCEALSCGCIPILTNIPSFRMMTDNGRLGLLYKAGKVDALLDALISGMKIDRQGAKELVLEYFERKLSFDANAKRIINVLNEIRGE